MTILHLRLRRKHMQDFKQQD
ncbi:hypothetical protein Golax_025831 [Gossypium laxum]|uniref:Uncharacterized protein n=2 Tax=Gossypium TaxID=3633 RepID=A0A7J8YT50_GOSAI|nr:hypothetical protein [Gossypium aridum]MBA0729891.1 hypothetical protein [Gossypium laxum]